MVRNGNRRTSGAPHDDVATTLSTHDEASLFECSHRLASGDARQSGHSGSDSGAYFDLARLNGQREAFFRTPLQAELNLARYDLGCFNRNWKAILGPYLKPELARLTHIVEGFFDAFTLRYHTWQSRHLDGITAFGLRLEYYGEFHDPMIAVIPTRSCPVAWT